MSYDDDITAIEIRVNAASTPIQRVDLLNELAWWQCRKTPEQSLITLTKVQAELAQVDHAKGKYDHDTVMSRHHLIRGEYPRAITLATAAADHYRTEMDGKWMCRVLSVLGYVYVNLSDYINALKIEQEHYTVAQTHDDQEEMAIALNAMGRISKQNLQYGNALKYYSEALTIIDSIQDHYAKAIILNNQASLLRDMAQYKESIEKASQSLAIMEAHHYVIDKISPYGQLGQTYFTLGDYERAIEYFEKKIVLLKDSDRIHELCTAQIQLASVYNQTAQPQAAITLLKIALPVLVEIDAKLVLSECHEQLAQAYQQQGDYQQALQHYQQFHEITRAIFNENSDTKLKNLEILYQVERAQQAVQLERQLRDQDQQRFEQLSQMKDEFVSSITHDLKNPLAGLIMSLELLERHLNAGNDARVPAIVEKMKNQSMKMGELITNLLDIARLETDHSLNLTEVTLNRVLEKIKRTLTEFAEKKSLQLEVIMPDSPLVISADTLQLERVFDNLVTNAIKFTPAGGRIQLRAECDTANVTVTLADTGIGIAEHDLPYIFDRFYRAGNAEDHAIDGTGLGLAIVRTIIEKHGGTISVQSILDVGTTFTVALPLRGAADEIAAAD